MVDAGYLSLYLSLHCTTPIGIQQKTLEKDGRRKFVLWCCELDYQSFLVLYKRYLMRRILIYKVVVGDMQVACRSGGLKQT